MKCFLSLICFISLRCAAQDVARQIDSSFQQKIKEAGIVGLAAVIVSDKGIAWSGAYGYADLEKHISFTTATIMNIGSVSKSITGLCVMRAVQEKKLSLDEDVNKYLPFKVVNPYFPGDKITMRQLVVHTSGILDQDPAYGDSAYDYSGDPKTSLGAYLKDYLIPGGRYYQDSNFAQAKPGSQSHYSNVGAALAGYIIECVTGMSLNAYSKKFLFGPLQLKRTGWLLRDIDTTQHARLYSRQGDTLTGVPWYGLVTYPDGGVRTSVNDLATILLSVINRGNWKRKQVLKPSSVQELWRPNFTAAHKPQNFDYDFASYNEGIFWSMTDSLRKIGHIGRDPGVNTYMYYDKSLHKGLIIIYNTSLRRDVRLKFEEVIGLLWNYAKDL